MLQGRAILPSNDISIAQSDFHNGRNIFYYPIIINPIPNNISFWNVQGDDPWLSNLEEEEEGLIIERSRLGMEFIIEVWIEQSRLDAKCVRMCPTVFHYLYYLCDYNFGKFSFNQLFHPNLINFDLLIFYERDR